MPNETISRRSALILILGLTGCFGKSTAHVYIQPPIPPSVWFIEPKDGAEVASPFKVRFGLSGREVRPANDYTENTGHHHLLIDQKPYEKGYPIPTSPPAPPDPNVRHYGDIQVKDIVGLPLGEHTLTAQFTNGTHNPEGGLFYNYDPDKSCPSDGSRILVRRCSTAR